VTGRARKKVRLATDSSADEQPKLCPSAPPNAEGSVAFGIVGGTAEQPVVSYLDEPLPVTPELLQLARPVRPTEVFRFAAPCAEGGCRHFDGANCRLGRKLAENVPTDRQRLPACRLRPSCRWWHEQGRAACLRCPLVVTTPHGASEALLQAADPATA
jgi:hypothetical protein